MAVLNSLFLASLLAFVAHQFVIVNHSNHLHWSDKVQAFVESGSFFNYKGLPIFYKYHSNAHNSPLVLLIHGYPTSSYDWVGVWDELMTHNFSIVAMDMLGFGFSAKPNIEYSILEQADIFEKLFTHLNLKHQKVHILSHDYGDTVAQELLWRSDNKRPDSLHVASLCMLNGGIIPALHRPLLVQTLLLNPVLGPLVSQLLVNRYTFRATFLRVLSERGRPSDKELDDIWSIISHNNGHLISHRLISYIHDRRYHGDRWVSTLQLSKVPLRLINGPADPISGRHLAQEYSRIIPNPDVVILDDNIAHYPQLEDLAGVMKHYLSFAKKH